jgi:hypothetical protein
MEVKNSKQKNSRRRWNEALSIAKKLVGHRPLGFTLGESFIR